MLNVPALNNANGLKLIKDIFVETVNLILFNKNTKYIRKYLDMMGVFLRDYLMPTKR